MANYTPPLVEHELRKPVSPRAMLKTSNHRLNISYPSPAPHGQTSPGCCGLTSYCFRTIEMHILLWEGDAATRLLKLFFGLPRQVTAQSPVIAGNTPGPH